ncbi:MAG: hypothetical protein JNM27_07025 [Leptospirales bacterium]|nr:hypothetical protein [Leptospirales bacterium]
MNLPVANRTGYSLGIGSAVVCGILRVIQTVNFAPIGAFTIYSGARIQGTRSFLIPLLLMLVTDAVLGLTRYGWQTWTLVTPFIYFAFVVNILMGRLLRDTESPLAIIGATAAGSIQFFVTSNLGVWLTSGMYSLDLIGLVDCFVKAIPFHRLTFLSDILFTCSLFLAHHFLAAREAEPAQQPETRPV